MVRTVVLHAVLVVTIFAIALATPTRTRVSKDTPRRPAPLVVRDSKGALVGSVIEVAAFQDQWVFAARTVGRHVVAFLVSANGFVDFRDHFDVLYEGADCAGTPRIPEYPDRGPVLLPNAEVFGHVAYYPTGTATKVPLESEEQGILAPGDCAARHGTLTERGTCCTSHRATDTATSVARVVDLSTFGLTPSFHVEER